MYNGHIETCPYCFGIKCNFFDLRMRNPKTCMHISRKRTANFGPPFCLALVTEKRVKSQFLRKDNADESLMQFGHFRK